MAGVEGQAQVDRTAARADVAAETLVVLHVAGWQGLGRRVVELGEQVGGHLAQGVHQHVQAATVGHADDDLLHAAFSGALHHLVHADDEALAAFQAEALLADVLGVQVALQAFGRSEPVEDVLLLGGREVRLAADRFEPFLPPALFHRVGAMHELGTDGAAVGFTQRLHDLAQAHVLGLGEIGVHGRERDVHVGLAQVVERGLELGNLRTFGALERVQVGPAAAQEPVGGNQALHVHLLAGHGQIGLAGLQREGIGLGTLGEALDDRRMGHVAAVTAVDGRHVLEIVEVSAPGFRHAARVEQVGFVQLFDVGRIAPEQVRIRPGLLHHLALTFCPGFQSLDGLINLPRPRLHRLAD